MIDFSFTEEQEIFRDAVREWLRKNLPLERVRENDESQRLSKELLKGLGDLGLLLMTVPEEHGGAGADWVTTAIAAEELGYADISIALPVFFLVQAGWGFVVDRYCTDAVRDAVIRRAASGNAFIGIGVTEPGGGSDVASFQTALKRGDGCWIVNGEKTYISGTVECQELGGGYFSTGYNDRSRGHRGMTAFYLPLDAPGVEVTKRFDDMGRMAISTGGFKMTDVVVPDEHQIGETNRGFYLTMEGFDAARILVAASCVGATQRGLEIGMEYIKERRAFGQPLATYQSIQFDLADMTAHLEAVRALVYKTAWMQDRKYQEETFTPLDVSKWISMCKYLAPHLAFDVFKRTLLWMGAYGYTKECPLEMGLRGVMSYCIGAEGATNIQKIIIARETMGREWMR